MKNKTVPITILSVLIALTLGFIWINSCLPPETSGNASLGVYQKIVSVVATVFGEQASQSFSKVFTEQVLRKLAHFLEFGVLGIELAFLYAVIGKLTPKSYAFLGLYGVVVAVVDESIQILSQRGARITDALIDISGYLVCCLFTVLIIKLTQNKKPTKN